MSIDRRKFEWNLNTIISLVTLAGMVIGGVYYWANTVRDLDEVKQWQATHDKTTEGRLLENRTLRGQMELRIKTNESAIEQIDRKQDQNSYRVTVLETSMANQQMQQQKTNDQLSEISGDMKVVKELLQRMEAERKRAMR